MAWHASISTIHLLTLSQVLTSPYIQLPEASTAPLSPSQSTLLDVEPTLAVYVSATLHGCLGSISHERLYLVCLFLIHSQARHATLENTDIEAGGSWF